MKGKHLYDGYLFHEAFLEYNKPGWWGGGGASQYLAYPSENVRPCLYAVNAEYAAYV